MLPLVVLKKKILLKMEWVMKEKMKNIICKTVIFLCVMLLCAGIGGNYDVKNVQAKTVVREITIGKGKSYALSEDFTISKKASYRTSNKKVATARNGKITGKKYGKAKVTVRNNGKTYVYKVTVSKVYLTKQNVKLNVKKSATVKVKGAKGKVKWTSSNKKVATVKNGKIVARKKGKAVVTAKVKATGAVLKCQVTVVSAASGNADPANGNNDAGNGNNSGSGSTGNNDNTGNDGNSNNTGGNTNDNNTDNATPYLAKLSNTKDSWEPVSKITLDDSDSMPLCMMNCYGKTVLWTSSDTDVVTITQPDARDKTYVNIHAGVKSGTGTVTATVDGKVYSCTVEVTLQPKQEPYLAVYSENSGTMEPVSELTWNFGEETYTYIYLVNADADTITWDCTDANVVNIYDMGNPTYVAVSNNIYGGKATVTATCNGKTYSCGITSYLLRDHTRSMEEGTGFDYEELKEIIESAVTSAGTTEKVIDVQEPLEWSRTDLIKKNVTQDGSYTHYTVEGSGDTVITGMTEDGYTKVVLTITSTGKYIEKQGTYDEELTNEVYDLLKLEKTRNTDSTSACYSMPEDQLEFLLETADRWYDGEISERSYHNLAMYMPFENGMCVTDPYGNKMYSTSCTCETVTLSNAGTAEEIVKGICSYMGCENLDPQKGWTWARNLLYLKIHTDGNNVYVYMIP